MAASEAVVMARIPATADEDLVIRRNHHQGQDFMDLRLFAADQTRKVGLPLAQGLCLPRDKWREPLPLLQAAIDGDTEEAAV